MLYMRETAAVVVTYNRKKLLSECLMHLQNQKTPLDIIVVDNAGTDGTDDLFTAPPDNLHYFNTGKNLGGAGGFNYGIRFNSSIEFRESMSYYDFFNYHTNLRRSYAT